MAKLKVLILNGCTSMQGDIHMLLLALTNLQGSTLEFHAATQPIGAVYERVRSLNHVKIIPIDMGSGDGGYLPGRARRYFVIARAISILSRYIFQQRVDAIYTIDRTVSAHIAAVLSHLTRRPLVLSSHYPLYPGGNMLNRMVVRRATRIHAHSLFLISHLLPYVHDKSRIILIPNAIQIEDYNLSSRVLSIREEMGIPPEAPVVVMCGRLSPYKGQDDLIRAAPKILKAFTDAYFLIAGHDTAEAMHTHGSNAVSFKSILEDLIADLGVSQRVRLLGYYPDIASLMGAGDIATMPSWEEPFGLVALEAMAMSKPVVASNAGGVPEFLTNGVTGILVAPRDPMALAEAILQLLNQPEQAKAMGRAGRQHVERAYTAQHYAANIERLLLDVAEQ